MEQKKKIVQKNEESVDDLKRQLAEQKAEIARLNKQLTSANDSLEKHWSGLYNRMSIELLEEIFEKTEQLQHLITCNTDDFLNLSPLQRRRLRGAGMRRYGFIDKLSDVIQSTRYESRDIKECLRYLEVVRNISLTLEAALRTSNDILLTLGDDAYRMALIIYRQISIDAREGDPIAQALFTILRQFFRPKGKRTTDEPTEAEVERDMKALLHGRKDGKIIIENEKPHLTGGKRVIADDVHSAKVGLKERSDERLTVN